MPSLLRGTITVLALLVMVLGIVLVAVAEFVTGPDAGRLVRDALAICGLTIPPLVGGSSASYRSWGVSARTRLRVWTVLLLPVQVGGAAQRYRSPI